MLYISNTENDRGSNFVMMCGAPGSGKTTFAKKYVDEYENWTRVAPDDIRRLTTGSAMDMSQDHEVFSIVYDTIRDELEHGANVIYDATNCNAHYRRGMIDFVRKIEQTNMIVCLVARTDIRTCFDRNESREDGCRVPDDVVERMYISLKNRMPSITEGFDVVGYF